METKDILAELLKNLTEEFQAYKTNKDTLDPNVKSELSMLLINLINNAQNGFILEGEEHSITLPSDWSWLRNNQDFISLYQEMKEYNLINQTNMIEYPEDTPINVSSESENISSVSDYLFGQMQPIENFLNQSSQDTVNLENVLTPDQVSSILKKITEIALLDQTQSDEAQAWLKGNYFTEALQHLFERNMLNTETTDFLMKNSKLYDDNLIKLFQVPPIEVANKNPGLSESQNLESTNLSHLANNFLETPELQLIKQPSYTPSHFNQQSGAKEKVVSLSSTLPTSQETNSTDSWENLKKYFEENKKDFKSVQIKKEQINIKFNDTGSWKGPEVSFKKNNSGINVYMNPSSINDQDFQKVAKAFTSTLKEGSVVTMKGLNEEQEKIIKDQIHSSGINVTYIGDRPENKGTKLKP